MASTGFVRSVKTVATLAMVCAASMPAHAESTWNFGTGGCTDPAAAAFGNTYTCNSAIPTAIATAWATNGTAAGATFASAYLSPNGTNNSGGFGVKNVQEGLAVVQPDHALDNNGQTDLMMLSFGASTQVALSSINISYKPADADVSVLRYTGSSAPAALTGKTIGGLLTSGWELVGNYANLVLGNNVLNTGGKTSSWWLISAYNANYGSTGSGNGSASAAANFDATADYIKILAVAGTPTSNTNVGVPEPGSLALVGAALAGILVARKRTVAAR